MLNRHLAFGVLLYTFGIACSGSSAVLASGHSTQGLPKTVVWNSAKLLRVRNGEFEKDASFQAAKRLLRTKAEDALKCGPYSVVNQGDKPPSGDLRDYMSYATYFWPNPDTEDGLPYVRRDGVHNREKMAEGDRPVLAKFADEVATLALAGYVFDEQKYSLHAAKLLRAWFIDSKTKMNPHLQFGQAIPGICEGRCIGIIDTKSLIFACEAASLLEGTPAWPRQDEEAMKDWVTSYLRWLQTHEFGIQEHDTRNNHATFYDVQVAVFALFVGNRELAKKTVEEVKPLRIDTQIEPSGMQPHEIARTNGLTYSLANLAGFCLLARIGESVDVDLWQYKSAEGSSIRGAFDYLLPYLTSDSPWPYQQISGIPAEWPHEHAFYLAARAYDDVRYLRPTLGVDGKNLGTGSLAY